MAGLGDRVAQPRLALGVRAVGDGSETAQTSAATCDPKRCSSSSGVASVFSRLSWSTPAATISSG